MYTSTLFLAGAISVASAQSTIALFLPGFDQQAVLASIAGSDATATTYALGCPAGESPARCGVPPSFTLTQGPTTAHWTYSADGSFEQVDCSLGGTTTALCTVTATPITTGASVITTGLSGVRLASQFQIVTITDSLAVQTDIGQSTDGGPSASIPGGQSLSGVTLLTGSGPSTTPAQTSTSSGVSTATVATTASTTGASGTSPATAASKTSTAGMSQITGNAGWAVGGVALALAVAGL